MVGVGLVLFAVAVAPLLWLEILEVARKHAGDVGAMARMLVAVRHVAAMV